MDASLKVALIYQGLYVQIHASKKIGEMVAKVYIGSETIARDPKPP